MQTYRFIIFVIEHFKSKLFLVTTINCTIQHQCRCDNIVFHKRTHLFLFTGSGGSRAARIASSKTFFKPFCVSAEHSTYFTALNSRASLSAASTVIGFCFTFESFSIVAASSRKSICVPTSKNGVFGQ